MKAWTATRKSGFFFFFLWFSSVKYPLNTETKSTKADLAIHWVSERYIGSRKPGLQSSQAFTLYRGRGERSPPLLQDCWVALKPSYMPAHYD